MSIRFNSILAVFTLLAFSLTLTSVKASATAQANANTYTESTFSSSSIGYFRDPNRHGNKLVFVAQSDLWLSQLGSTAPAMRLTTHPNMESSPRFSPNGEQIAFVARYNNMQAVHLIPTNGGVAKQITFELGATKLHNWIDDEHLLISTTHDTGMHSSWVLKKVNVNTLVSTSLPLSDAVEGSISSDGNTLVFVQHGLQVSTDNANHYKGGAAGEIWRFNLEARHFRNSNNEATRLTTDHEGSARTVMLFEASNEAQNRIYFISNQNNIDNIWSMKLDGSDKKQHTQFEDWAVRDASIHGDSIVFQHGADLKLFNINNESVSNIDISLQSDFVDLRTRYINKPMEYFEDASIANDGKSAVVIARGKMALANNQSTRLVNIASDPVSRNRDAVISNDGKYVYAISDASGDYEIWRFDAKGGNKSKQLTSNGDVLKTSLYLSPNGETLAYTEKSGQLWFLNLKSGKSTVVYDEPNNGISNLTFSADSRYLAFEVTLFSQERSRIFLKDTQSKNAALLTSEKYQSFSPSFSDDTKWLYFLSDRSFTPSPGSPWGDRNMGQAFDKRTEIYAIALNKDAEFPFAAPTELSVIATKDKSGDVQDEEEEEETKSVEIDFDQIHKRLWKVDVPADNYAQLIANEKALLIRQEQHLKSLAYEHDAKLKDMTDGVNYIEASANGKHVMVLKGAREKAQIFSIPASDTFPSEANDHKIDLSKWQLTIKPQQEWQQLFKDAWLMHRDSFYDANMRGLDWQKTKEKYMPLLARMTERSDLNDIFEQMMGELNSLHSQVRGGDLKDDPNAPNPSVLGASLRDSKDGVLIDTIYMFDTELLDQAPPLARPGVNAANGDIITAVNKQAVNNVAQLRQALYNQQGQQVLLSIQRGKGRKAEKIETVVVPAPANRETRYRRQHWVHKNLKKVQSTDNDIGYLHLYAMGGGDIASFARDFYAQYEKQGLIIDVRRNRGGNVDSVIIEKLMRRAWSFWRWPNGYTSTNMQQAFRGHLVVLADQFTYSDGETFTAGIKALDLGTVIGKQTAGAGVWLSGGNRLVDRGIARVAEFPVFAMDGRWITEAEGIAPHIEVDNLPHATYKGEDAQLAAAIALLQTKIAESPVTELQPKPFPPVKEAADDILNNTN
ncbi:S41 family peptidase [Glaciecola siphonariae]|uniref:Tricorn protease homolog n=1 Tax=Glaciecola siphonariae TaxID=521012 RepID=A0ABV9LX06_9ALTE